MTRPSISDFLNASVPRLTEDLGAKWFSRVYETSIAVASCDAGIVPIRRLESIGTCYLSLVHRRQSRGPKKTCRAV
jgi:hypothetical protein